MNKASLCNPLPIGRDSVQVSRSSLPAWAVDALHGEHTYARNIGALAAVALAYCNAGRSKHEFVHQAAGLAQLVSLDDKRPGRDARYLHRAWDFAQVRAQVPAEFRGQEVRQAVQAARERAELDRWAGQAGNSTRAVLEAVLVIAQERSTSTPALAVRTVAEHAGVGKSTAARGLARLVERGYLALVKVAHYDQAATYRLSADSDVVGTRTTPYGEGSVSQLFPFEPSRLAQYFASDAFAPGSPLGRTAARVLDALDELTELTPAQLSERLGLSTRCIRAALDRLEAVGVAQRHRAGRGWAWTGRHDELDAQEISDAYGTTGTLARRADAFRAERNWYADRVQDFRARGLYRPRNAATGSLARATGRIRAERALRVAS